jgi:hypothetical protein
MPSSISAILRRDHGEPTVVLAERDLDLLLEAQDLRVEAQCVSLVVDQHAGEVDAHRTSSLFRLPS